MGSIQLSSRKKTPKIMIVPEQFLTSLIVSMMPTSGITVLRLTIDAYGNKYVGEYLDGKYHGQGTFTNDNGDNTSGNTGTAKDTGKGTYTFADGNKYAGEWKDGLIPATGLTPGLMAPNTSGIQGWQRHGQVIYTLV